MKKTPSSRSSHADVQDYADADEDDDVQDDDDDICAQLMLDLLVFISNNYIHVMPRIWKNLILMNTWASPSSSPGMGFTHGFEEGSANCIRQLLLSVVDVVMDLVVLVEMVVVVVTTSEPWIIVLCEYYHKHQT